MKRLLAYKKTIAGILLATVAGATYVFWQGSQPSAPAYRALTLTRGNVDVTVVATGIVQPSNRLEIKPPIAGRVEQVLVREGQYVRRGDLLAWMSSSERATLIDAARAKGPVELKRWEELYRPTPIIAPIDGTVILRNAEPGQTFQSQDAVLVMSDRLIVRAQVDETDIARIALRQPARLTLDAYADQPIEGTVNHVAFEAKTVNNVITYEVDVLPQKVPAFMRSGMTASVNFVVDSRRDVVRVPAEAVRVEQGRAHALVPGASPRDLPRQRDLVLGVSDGRHIEVRSGLSAGDTVLVPQLMQAGQPTGGSPFFPSRRR